VKTWEEVDTPDHTNWTPCHDYRGVDEDEVLDLLEVMGCQWMSQLEDSGTYTTVVDFKSDVIELTGFPVESEAFAAALCFILDKK